MNPLYILRRMQQSLAAAQEILKREQEELTAVIRHLEDKVCEVKKQEENEHP